MTKFSFFLSILFFLGLSQPILAHGAHIDYQQTSTIVIQATYDDGTPMIEAQTIVYAPEDPTNPWLKGFTDELGRFVFTPDPKQTGNWEVKVRQSGHGNIVSISLTEGIVNSEQKALLGGYSLGQKWLMAIAIIWGFVGTAFYFARK